MDKRNEEFQEWKREENENEDSILKIRKKMFKKDVNNYYSNSQAFLSTMNQHFEQAQKLNKNKSSEENNQICFEKIISKNGEELFYGFEEIHELEDYAFLVDFATMK